MISLDIWTFIKDVFRILKRDKVKEQIIDSIVDIRFGGGQLHIGKPEIWIMNNATTDLLSISLNIRFKRLGKFSRWKNYFNHEWQIIRPRECQQYILSFQEVSNRLVDLKTRPHPTDEPLPEYADLLYPRPVVFRVEYDFILENTRHTRRYILKPSCIYPQNLTTESTGKLYWSFEKV